MENVYSLENALAKPYAMQRPPRRRRVDLLVPYIRWLRYFSAKFLA